MSHIQYSIIISIKNNIHFTERCLISLIQDLKNESIPLDNVEIIYVDCESVDGIDQLVEHYKGINIKLLKLPNEEDNFSHKNNIGAKAASGEFLILLNNDIEVLANFVRPMRKAFELKDVGIVSNKHYFTNMLVNHVGIAFKEDRSPTHIYPGEADIYGFVNKNRYSQAVTAACCMVRREEFLSIGGFDETYLYGYEDVDLCLSYKKKLNKRSYVAIDSKMIHFGQSSFGRERGEDKNREYFMEKWKDEEFELFSDIYRKDGYFRIKAQEKLRRQIKETIKKILNRKPNTSLAVINDENEYKLNDKTIVFFFDERFNSFNVVNENLYQKFVENYSNEFEIKKDHPSNFHRYHRSEAITVTWTHFWDDYFVQTRENKSKDFRLFAINYENVDPNIYVDYWTKHIVHNKFQILSISEYCSDFLRKAGVDSSRIHLQHLGFWDEFADIKPRETSNEKLRYLIVTNSNDPERYNTELAIASFAEAFKDNKDKGHLIIKDYGGAPDYVYTVTGNYLKDYSYVVKTGKLENNELAELYLESDILLSPFRGEGFGMKLLEVGVLGIPVVAPAYGGPKDFLDKLSFIDLKYTLQVVGNTIDKKELFLFSNYQDCKVDADDFVKKIKYTYENFPKLKKVALEKRDAVLKQFHWKTLASNLLSTLKSAHSITRQKLTKEFDIPEKLIINPIENPQVSMIINTYNRPEDIEVQLNWFTNFIDLQKIETEIIIVDDGSDKDYLPTIKKFEKSKLHIRYFKYDQNRGMTFPKNLGIYNAKGKIAIFLGDDIRPLPGFISRRVQLHQNDPLLLVLGHTEWAPSIRNNLVAEFSVKYSSFQFGYEGFRNNGFITPVHLYTSNVSFNPDEIRNKNLYFDQIEEVRLYEDSLWGQKLSDQGFRLLYERKIEALHDHKVSLDWLIKRSEIVGATRSRLFHLFPESRNFTDMQLYLKIIKAAFVSSLININTIHETTIDEVIKAFEESIPLTYSRLEKAVNTESIYETREFIKNQMVNFLHFVHEYYTWKGILSELNLPVRKYILLDFIHNKFPYVEHTTKIVHSDESLTDHIFRFTKKTLARIGKKIISLFPLEYIIRS